METIGLSRRLQKWDRTLIPQTTVSQAQVTCGLCRRIGEWTRDQARKGIPL